MRADERHGRTMVSRSPERSSSVIVVVARCVAVAVGLVMAVYLLTRSPVVRFDQPFFVPDVLIAVLLFASAALPRRVAVPALIFSLAWTAGILLVACLTYVVRGDPAYGLVALVTVSAVTAALLVALVGRWAAPS